VHPAINVRDNPSEWDQVEDQKDKSQSNFSVIHQPQPREEERAPIPAAGEVWILELPAKSGLFGEEGVGGVIRAR
jgi:hypothetical protein